MPAHAQYWGGWGGWGGGSATAPGDIARGMGVFAAGVGQMNVADAQAASINSTTAMRWNNYEWAINQSLYQDYNRRMIEKGQETAKSVNEIRDRLRNNPTPSDIQGGRALNAMLDDFQNPRVQAEALKISERTMVPATIVKRIPFFYSSDPFTFSLSQYLEGNVEVPDALHAPEFADDMKNLRELVDKARKEDLESEESPVTADTHRQLNEATKALRTKFEAKFARNSPEFVRTEPFLKTITGFTTLLRSTDFEREIARLQEDKQISLFDLLSFMTVYSLRFGPANTPEQRATYNQLYPVMAERRAQILSLIAQHTPADAGSAAAAATAPPTHLFQQLDFDQLDKTTTTPKPPKPRGGR